MADTAQVRDDMARHICQQLESDLTQHMRVAAAVLPADELAAVVIKVASGLMLGCALFTLQQRKDTIAPDALYDLVMKSLSSIAEAVKPMVLEQLRSIEAKSA